LKKGFFLGVPRPNRNENHCSHLLKDFSLARAKLPTERTGDDEKSEFESFVETVAADNESDEVEVLISATNGYAIASQSANVSSVDFDFDQDPKNLKGWSLEIIVKARLN
jgi:hypothetical protein